MFERFASLTRFSHGWTVTEKIDGTNACVLIVPEAESIKIKNSAVAVNPGYQSEWVRKWDGQLPKTVYCTSEQPCVTVDPSAQ